MRALTAFTCVLIVASPDWAAVSMARSAVLRDVQDQAVASCLSKQSVLYLREQGQFWAEAIVQRGHGNLSELRRVDQAVEAEIARATLPVYRVDGPRPRDEVLAVAFCHDIIDRPAVRSSIKEAYKALARSYPHP